MDDSNLLQKFVAEMIGPFFLVFAGVGSMVAVQNTGQGGLLAIALAHGLALGLAVYATAHVSGAHLNPAVTISMWVTHRIRALPALVYIVAQLLGGTLAALLIKYLLPIQSVMAIKLGATLPAADITPTTAMLLEAVLTFFLVFVIYATAVDERGAKGAFGLAIGLTVTFGILAGGPFTGASMNPARSFGPAFVGGHWMDWWVYWAGPALGAIVAGLLYDGVLMDRRQSRIRG